MYEENVTVEHDVVPPIEEMENVANENNNQFTTGTYADNQQTLLGDLPSTESTETSAPLTAIVDETGAVTVSGGDFVNTLSNTQTVVAEEEIPLFESDIHEYNTTEGLLFIIMIEIACLIGIVFVGH